MNLSTGGTQTFTGPTVDQCDLSLPADWSLVGVPKSGTRVDDIVQIPAGCLISVFGFQGGYFSLSGEDLLEEGRAYWFNLNEPCQLILNSDPGSG